MLQQLKDLTGANPDQSRRGFRVVKYWHPDSGKSPEHMLYVDTEHEAKAICEEPAGSCKDGDTSEWYFLNYVDAGSKTWRITLW